MGLYIYIDKDNVYMSYSQYFLTYFNGSPESSCLIAPGIGRGTRTILRFSGLGLGFRV